MVAGGDVLRVMLLLLKVVVLLLLLWLRVIRRVDQRLLHRTHRVLAFLLGRLALSALSIDADQRRGGGVVGVVRCGGAAPGSDVHVVVRKGLVGWLLLWW